MRATVLDRPPPRERAAVVVGLLLSLVGHVALAERASRIEPREKPAPVWVEMTVQDLPPPPPPPPPPPEPEPEPEPVRPKPPSTDVVKFEETVDRAPTEPPPPDRKAVPRLIQGLNNQSFADGVNTGLQVRAGTSTAVRATDTLMARDEATQSAVLPYASVTTTPRVSRRALLTVPEELRAAGIQGTVQVELTIDAEGAVVEVVVVAGLHPAADAACVRDLKLTRWKPGLRDGTPVGVSGVPFSCRYEVIE
jgi:TonB family protein